MNNLGSIKVKKEDIAIYLFVLPFLLRWLFPASMEGAFSVEIYGYSLFIFDLMYVAFPFFSTCSWDKWKFPVISLLLLFILTGFIGHIFNYNPTATIFNILLGSSPIAISLILILLFPFTRRQIQILKYPFLLTYIMLSCQVILASLGIVDFGTATPYDVSGVYRVSTTIGAATGTGVIMFMLGAFIISFYLKGKLRVLFIVLYVITISLTVSRGPFLATALFFVVFIWREVKESRYKWVSISAIVILIIVMYSTGLFNPIMERVEVQSSDITTGRDELFEKGLEIIERSPAFGIGNGNIFPEKDLRNSTFEPLSYIATHNYYIVVAAECGIVGFILLLICFILLLSRMDYKKSYVFYIILITQIISMNVEAIFTFKEFSFMLAFLYSIGIYRLEEKGDYRSGS